MYVWFCLIDYIGFLASFPFLYLCSPVKTVLFKNSYPLSYSFVWSILMLILSVTFFHFIHWNCSALEFPLNVFFDFYIIVKFFILFIYCFYYFICFSQFFCNCWFSLKRLFWLFYKIDQNILYFWVSLLDDYCSLLVMTLLSFSMFLVFLCCFHIWSSRHLLEPLLVVFQCLIFCWYCLYLGFSSILYEYTFFPLLSFSVAEFLSLYVFSVSYNIWCWLLEATLLFSRKWHGSMFFCFCFFPLPTHRDLIIRVYALFTGVLSFCCNREHS